MSRHTLVAIRYSHERRDERPSKLLGAAPRAEHGFLHRVVGLESGAKHAVGVARQLTAIALELSLETRRVGLHGGGRLDVGHRSDPTCLRRIATIRASSVPALRSQRSGRQLNASTSPAANVARAPAKQPTSTVPASTTMTAPDHSAAPLARTSPGTRDTVQRSKPCGSGPDTRAPDAIGMRVRLHSSPSPTRPVRAVFRRQA